MAGRFGFSSGFRYVGVSQEPSRAAAMNPAKRHTALSNFGKDFPAQSFMFSSLLWLSIATIIGCFSQNCCHISPPGKGLAIDNRGLGSVENRINNGLCNCAALGEKCGCLGYLEYGTNKNRDTQHKVLKCAATCCAVGECIKVNHDLTRSKWGGPDDTTIFRWPEKKQGEDQPQSVRLKQARKLYADRKAEYYPRCRVDNSTAMATVSPVKERAPECKCVCWLLWIAYSCTRTRHERPLLTGLCSCRLSSGAAETAFAAMT